jgi:hypothetical protein
MTAAYLAADAAAQADRELPAFSRSRPVPPHVLQELDYASNLFGRADRAICAELDALEAAGVALDRSAVRSARLVLSRLGFECQMAAISARKAQKNGL